MLMAGRAAKRQALKARRESSHSATERAYLAGLIDGEGSIRIQRRGAAGGKTFRPGQYTAMVEMVNTDEQMIRWVQERWGGAVSHTPANPAANRKAKWQWRVVADKVLPVLDDIFEFLRTKRQQAKLCRRFQRYAQVAGRRRDEKVEALHATFHESLRVLNKRGL